MAEVADLEALLALVAIGDAVTFLAQRTAALVTPVTSMVWRAVGDLDLKLSDVVAWRSKDADLPVVRALVESARAVRPLLRSDPEPSRPAGRTRASEG
jgi:hypothetical protein